MGASGNSFGLKRESMEFDESIMTEVKASIHRLGRAAVYLVAGLVLSACASSRIQQDIDAALSKRGSVLVEQVAGSAGVEGSDPESGRQEPTLIVGNDRMIKLPQAKPVTVLKGGAVSLKFEQAPVTDVVHAVLGDLLGMPYVIHQPVAGEVTAYTQTPVPPGEALAIIESVLGASGVAIVQDGQGMYHVGRPDALRSIGNVPRSMKTLPAGQGMVVVPLEYISAAEMAEILRPIAPAEAFVRVDTVRNLLILSGGRSQLDSWLEFVDMFDVDMMKGMSVGLFPLRYASIKEVAETLAAVAGMAGGGGASAAVAAPQTGRGGAAARGAQANAPAAIPALPNFGPLGGAVRVIPLERLNALLVITPRAHYLQQAREWVEKLDRPMEAGDAPQLYIYPVQNGTAKHLASLLSAVFGGTSALGGRTTENSGVAPGLNSTTASTSGTSTGSNASRGAQRGDSISQLDLGSQVRVVADEKNNALLLYAPASEYKKIETALKRLDIAPVQVLIEATILEVTLTDELKYGLQWYFNDSLGSKWSGQGQLTSGSSSNLGPSNPGFSYSIVNGAGEVRAVLNALAQKSLINVISSPSLLVQDNHTATIQVGDQQPIRSSTTISDGGTTTSSIQYKDTGVNLEVTPSVNAGGMVSMDVDQEVTDVGSIDPATLQRSFLRRQIISRVAVRSGETVVMGGLIRDNSTQGRQGVPLLMDIPLVGGLFSTTTNNGNRTELLVMITPRVMRNDEELRSVTDEMRDRLSHSMGELQLSPWLASNRDGVRSDEVEMEPSAPVALP